MHLSKYEFRGAISAEHMRWLTQRNGQVCGHPLWTKREDDILRSAYPNYRAALKRLPRRTYYALRHRARKLGIRRRGATAWTTAEISRLRRLYPSTPSPALLQAFPGRSQAAIWRQAAIRGVQRERRYVTTGNALFEAVRTRCASLGYTMRDLDAIVRIKRYFRNASRRRGGRANIAKIGRAAQALDGELGVRWP